MRPENDPNRDYVPGQPPDPYTQDIKHTAISARVPEKVNRGVFSTATMILQTSEDFVIDFLSTIAPPQQVVARVIMTASTFAQMITALRGNLAKYEQQFGRLGLRQPISPLPPPSEFGEFEPEAATPSGGESSPGAPVPPPSPQAPTTQEFVSPYSMLSPGEPPQATPSHSASSSTPHAHHAPPPPPPPRIEDLYEQLKLPDELLGGAFANVVMIRHTPEEFCFDFIANFYPRSIVTNRVFLAAGRVPSFLDAMSSALRKYQQRGGR